GGRWQDQRRRRPARGRQPQQPPPAPRAQAARGRPGGGGGGGGGGAAAASAGGLTELRPPGRPRPRSGFCAMVGGYGGEAVSGGAPAAPSARLWISEAASLRRERVADALRAWPEREPVWVVGASLLGARELCHQVAAGAPRLGLHPTTLDLL